VEIRVLEEVEALQLPEVLEDFEQQE